LNPLIVGALPEVAGSVMAGLDRLFTSDAEREAARLAVLEALQQPHLLQAQANIEEARHASIFVAGWRPAIGWTCAAGLAYSFLLQPFAGVIASSFGVDVSQWPDIDSGELMSLTLALLGLGGLRTWEKVQGVTAGLPPIEPARPARPDPTRPARPDPTRPDPTRPARPDPARPDPTRPARPEPGQGWPEGDGS
jgi:hypothetical protein